jgi:peptide/nickel transport system substrate-binding protein
MYKKLFVLGLVLLLVGVFAGNVVAEDQVLKIATASANEASFSFTPTRCGGDEQNWQPFQWVPPMYFDVDMNLQPGIFNSWESNDDQTVWTFAIDPRAKFSDNTPVTAADVKGTWEVMAHPEYCGRSRGYFGNVKGFWEAREAADYSEFPGF